MRIGKIVVYPNGLLAFENYSADGDEGASPSKESLFYRRSALDAPPRTGMNGS